MLHRPSWTSYFLGLAQVVAQRSPDSQTKHGCVLTDQQHRLLSIGYNGFPRDFNDEELPSTRPDKYPWMIHSEENAILNYQGSLEDAIAYITGAPCHRCLRMMWQKGIRNVVHFDGYIWAREEEERKLVAEFFRHARGRMKVSKVLPDLSWLRTQQIGNDRGVIPA